MDHFELVSQYKPTTGDSRACRRGKKAISSRRCLESQDRRTGGILWYVVGHPDVVEVVRV